MTDMHDGWGDDAFLQWEGSEVLASDDDDDVSSVAPEDAGLSEDDEDAWGRGAIIDYTYASAEEERASGIDERNVGHDDGDESVSESSPEPQIDLESKVDLISRGMPDYDSWTIPKLQVLVEQWSHRMC